MLGSQSWTLQSNERQVSRMIISLSPCHTILLLMQPRILLAAFACAHQWLLLSLLSTMSFLTDPLLPSQSVCRQLESLQPVFAFWIAAFAFVFVQFRNVPVSPFLQAKSLWMPALLLGVYIHSCPCLVPPAHLVILCSTALSRSLMKMLNRAGPVTDSCSTLTGRYSGTH